MIPSLDGASAYHLFHVPLPHKKKLCRLEQLCLKVLLNQDCDKLRSSRKTYVVCDDKQVIDYYCDILSKCKKVHRIGDQQLLVIKGGG